MASASMERALKLAVVTGLRAALGPALIARAQHRPEQQHLAAAALGELVFDKLPFVPGRDTLPSLIARGLAGAWVASKCAEEDGADRRVLEVAAQRRQIEVVPHARYQPERDTRPPPVTSRTWCKDDGETSKMTMRFARGSMRSAGSAAPG